MEKLCERYFIVKIKRALALVIHPCRKGVRLLWWELQLRMAESRLGVDTEWRSEKMLGA